MVSMDFRDEVSNRMGLIPPGKIYMELEHGPLEDYLLQTMYNPMVFRFLIFRGAMMQNGSHYSR